MVFEGFLKIHKIYINSNYTIELVIFLATKYYMTSLVDKISLIYYTRIW